MKRTFWAIKVSPTVEDLIKQIYQDIPELGYGIKLVPPENVHITLKFLGDTEESKINAIVETVKGKVDKFSSFKIVVGGVGCFPNAKRPRVIYLGIKDGLEKLREISNIIEKSMEIFGYEREKREFTPHLTIGRVKDDKKALNGVEDFLRYQYEPITFQANQITFYESILKPEGAIYKPLSIINLK